MTQKEWTAEKFEPAEEIYDDSIEYCVYCYEVKPDWRNSCCGENHFMTGFQLKEREKELDEIDRQRVFMHEEKQYDPPMTETQEYLLNKEREEEHKSYDY